MLSIGEFSNICKVSTKTLRYYAEIGLLEPSEVNPENGYRYYAIEQLEIEKRWCEFSDEPWDEFYAGDDGEFTYYIDMVERKFARSSTASFDKRYDLLNDVDEMFRIIQNEK